MSKSLLHDWESSIEKNKNNTEELLKIAEDIYNTAYARGKASTEKLQGDLISRNALKEKLKPCEEGACEYTCKGCRFRVVTAEDIDNAPTVDTDKPVFSEIVFLDRPKGEWVRMSFDDKTIVYCSECHLHYEYPFNFCPNCGAEMRGKEE